MRTKKCAIKYRKIGKKKSRFVSRLNFWWVEKCDFFRVFDHCYFSRFFRDFLEFSKRKKKMKMKKPKKFHRRKIVKSKKKLSIFSRFLFFDVFHFFDFFRFLAQFVTNFRVIFVDFKLLLEKVRIHATFI